jgi:predicted MFS family arabinose efflux permease
VDRGVASAVYFTLYYLAGAAAGFLPGLAWQRWEWPGVAACAAAALALGFGAVLASDGRGGFRTCDLSRVKRALSH